MSFSEELMNFRAKYGLTQTEAAKVIGVSVTSYNWYENGTRQAPTFRQIKARLLMAEYAGGKGNV